MGLAALAMILCSIYVRDKAALDRAMRYETVKIVGTRQEPADSAQELGLIATALAKVNETDPSGWECPADDPECLSFEKMPGELVHNADFKAAAAAHLDGDGEWTGTGGDIETLFPVRAGTRDVSWPELGESPSCASPPDHTFLMVPAQMRALISPFFSARIAAAADISEILIDGLNGPRGFREDPKYAKFTKSLVQAYFISPDSLLRIWNPHHIDLCDQFSKTRLWAAKHYFVQFWEGERKDEFSTPAYIDYGGNGLVRTSCHVVEVPHLDGHDAKLGAYPRGHFLGIFCMDFKLPPEQVDLMRQQLFFDTADVAFPREGNYDIDDLSVKLVAPESKREAATETTPPEPPRATARPLDAALGVALAGAAGMHARKVELSPDDEALQDAIRMQGHSVDEAEVRTLLYAALPRANPLLREILRVSYRDKPAFLLPLGVSGDEFKALFFYPRSPRLPLHDDIFGVLGFLCGGAALISLYSNRRLHFQIAELRRHMTLLRSLQAGVVKGKSPDNEVTECNDRAEELCGRRLPKPGVRLDPAPCFFDMFDVLARETGDNGNFERIHEADIGRLRENGMESAYYARLRADGPPTWLLVRATPVMDAEQVRPPRPDGEPFRWRRRKVWQMARRGAFATLTEVGDNTARALNEKFH